jgi:hypothetical protein
MQITYSTHAAERMTQRGIGRGDVAVALDEYDSAAPEGDYVRVIKRQPDGDALHVILARPDASRRVHVISAWRRGANDRAQHAEH